MLNKILVFPKLPMENENEKILPNSNPIPIFFRRLKENLFLSFKYKKTFKFFETIVFTLIYFSIEFLPILILFLCACSKELIISKRFSNITTKPLILLLSELVQVYCLE